MYQTKLKPYNHQIAANQQAKNLPGFAYLCEMGTGKSKMLLDEIGQLMAEDKIDTAIILAPKGVYMNWIVKEIPVHFNEKSIPGGFLCAYWASTPTKEEKKQMENVVHFKGKRIIVCNIEALSVSQSKGYAFLVNNMLYRKVLLAVDESTTIKNVKSVRTMNVMLLGKLAKYRRILTGSPIANSPLDLYAQFKFLDSNIFPQRSFYAFKTKYAISQQIVLGGRMLTKIINYQNTEELQNLIKPVSFKILKKDCLDLPDKIYIDIRVEMDKEQQAKYQTMKNHLYLELKKDEQISVTSGLTKLLKLQQIASGFIIDENQTYHTFKQNNKLDALFHILEETQGKVIIWANFKAAINLITDSLIKEYGTKSTVRYDGSTSQVDRMEAVQRFQEDDTCRFFVANQQTAGKGITLTAANTVVYFCNNYSLEDRLQSEDRCHRIGQKNNVTYIDLISKDTIDTAVFLAIKKKKNIADLILNQGWDCIF